MATVDHAERGAGVALVEISSLRATSGGSRRRAPAASRPRPDPRAIRTVPPRPRPPKLPGIPVDGRRTGTGRLAGTHGSDCHQMGGLEVADAVGLHVAQHCGLCCVPDVPALPTEPPPGRCQAEQRESDEYRRIRPRPGDSRLQGRINCERWGHSPSPLGEIEIRSSRYESRSIRSLKEPRARSPGLSSFWPLALSMPHYRWDRWRTSSP